MKILHIDSSARRDGSVGRPLAQDLVHGLLGTAAEGRRTYRDLADGMPGLDASDLRARARPADEHDPEARASLELEDELIRELEAHDVLVLSVPIYNFSIPASLKAYIDRVARARRTFRYTSEGPVGLLEGKVAYLVVTSGGTALDSEVDFATPYLRHVLGFLGIHDVRVIDATRLMAGPESLARAQAQVQAAVASARVSEAA